MVARRAGVTHPNTPGMGGLAFGRRLKSFGIMGNVGNPIVKRTRLNVLGRNPQPIYLSGSPRTGGTFKCVGSVRPKGKKIFQRGKCAIFQLYLSPKKLRAMHPDLTDSRVKNSPDQAGKTPETMLEFQ
ncbi:hypothetical protein GWK47_026058 [Chionoecetes opilio]|uniref:Uncharacterized protein n=1 Tax=Chionoecetes opilio TaxID=41210 RepID=A0A8J8WFQ9_CHIOP|nr:hypothetical protein GWK47_026058 [Chionoecetes opilio]